MEEKILQYDMYHSFDRMGEGVMFQYRVKYDWDSIVKDDFSEQNFIVEAIGFDKAALCYLRSYHISVEAWQATALKALTSENASSAQEAFCEELPDEVYNEYSDARGF